MKDNMYQKSVKILAKHLSGYSDNQLKMSIAVEIVSETFNVDEDEVIRDIRQIIQD
jgi:hypothetical protein